MEQEINIIARLLATENINVVTEDIRTAAFDLENRTLVLPQWNTTKVVRQMLVGHEVGHARYTGIKYLDMIKELDFPMAGQYMNILEDVRVEKMIKNKYPGIKKTFAEGYKNLAEQDFFGVKGRDLKKAHLMDRLNLYFKVGSFYDIEFTSEERVFVERAATTQNLNDVKQLAFDIFTFIQDSNNQELDSDDLGDMTGEEAGDSVGDSAGEEASEEFGEEAGDSAGEESGDSAGDSVGDSAGEESGEESGDSAGEESSEEAGEKAGEEATKNSKNKSSDGANVGSPDIEGPITQENFDRNLNERVVIDEKRPIRYLNVHKIGYNPIISYKEVLKNTIDKASKYSNNISNAQTRYSDFLARTQNNVNYLVKEFEMRKAASTYQKSKMAKTGILDVKKLWGYKIKEELFKTTTVVDKGKNHGMIFLLDWSGSMSSCMKDTIAQLLNLVLFCRRINIPFQVFGFLDHNLPQGYNDYIDHCPRDDQKNIYPKTSFALLELFSHKMSHNEFNTMCVMLYSRLVEDYYGLGGTPLNEALLYMRDYIGTFQKAYNVEKLTFVTLTDGQGMNFAPSTITSSQYIPGMGYICPKYNIVDSVTKKHYSVDTDTVTQTSALLRIIKDRYNCNNIGFYLTRDVSPHEINYALRWNVLDYQNYRVDLKLLAIKMKKEGYIFLTNPGQDGLFIISGKDLKIKESDLIINKPTNTKAISKEFGEHMNSKVTSRVLLNKIIGYIA